MSLFKNRAFLVKIVKDTADGPVEEEVSSDDVVGHFRQHQFAYGLGLGLGVAGLTFLATRRFSGVGVGVPNEANKIIIRPFAFFSKQTVVSVISADRSGPPSWVVRCKETGDVFSSQKSAALVMDLSQSELSKHLNGMMDHVRGYHFDRICMAA